MSLRKTIVAMFAASGAVLIATAAAWACVSGPSVTLSTVNAKPGDEVTANIRDVRKADPVVVRWNAVDGPALATFTPVTDGSPFQGKFTIPADAKAGSYVVLFTQTGADGKATQMPVRTLLNVSPTGANPALGAPIGVGEQNRTTGLVTTDNSVSTATFILVALGVAGVGLFFVGVAALFAGRRPAAPAAARVQS